MQIFEYHIHMFSRTTDDYERMGRAGIAAVLEPAFWLGQPRTSAASFKDYFDTLVGWERFRAAQFGLWHFCTISLNPKEANDPALSDEVLALVDIYLDRDGVLGVGEIGFDDQTPLEERVFRRQLEMAVARGLPVLIHTPHRDKKRGVERILAILDEMAFPRERALVDHSTEETTRQILDAGCWCGHSLYPNTKMTPTRMVRLVREFGTERMLMASAADWGVSDPLKVPETVHTMRRAGFPLEEIERMAWGNPVAFFSQGGRLRESELLYPPDAEPEALFEGSSVLRGQHVEKP